MIRKTLYLLAALCLPSLAMEAGDEASWAPTARTTATENQRSLLESFSPEIIVIVLDYLDPESKKALFLASKGLHDLRYIHKKITLKHAGGLPFLLRMSALDDLRIDCKLGSEAIPELVLKRLKILSFSSYLPVRAVDLEALGGSTQLRELDLSYTRVTDASISHLMGLVNLSKFKVRSCFGVSSRGLSVMAGWINLRHLDLGGTRINIQDLGCLKEATRLHFLDLSNTNVTDETLADLAGLTQVRQLNLVRTQVTDEGLRSLAAWTLLQQLDLAHTQVSDEGLVILAGFIKHLNLRGCRRISVLLNENLRRLAVWAQLQYLDLSGTQVTNESLRRLATWTQLQQLDLSGTQVTNEGLGYLTRLIQLRQLSLTFTAVDDIGLGYLAALTRLQCLDVSGTQITDQGLSHLVALEHLQHLGFAHTAVSNEVLHSLMGLTQLRQLNMSFTQVTYRGRDYLRASQPHLQLSAADVDELDDPDDETENNASWGFCMLF